MGSLQLSVVICTYNRVALLEQALHSLFQQSLAASALEILVIDNASSDGTAALVSKLQQDYPHIRLRYLFEAEQGLGYARNTGYKQAKSELIAFMDDDAKAHPQWLETALTLFQTIKPTPMCVGGPILPFYSDVKPKWFKDGYQTFTWGPISRFLQFGESFYGSNMVWQRDCLERFGGFETSVGLKGNQLSMGEETALFMRVWESNEPVTFYYCTELVVYHYVPAFKMVPFYYLKRDFATGQDWFDVYGPFSPSRRFILSMRFLISLAVAPMRIALRTWRRRGMYPHIYNWVVEECKLVFFRLGLLARAVGWRIRFRNQ